MALYHCCVTEFEQTTIFGNPRLTTLRYHDPEIWNAAIEKELLEDDGTNKML